MQIGDFWGGMEIRDFNKKSNEYYRQSKKLNARGK